MSLSDGRLHPCAALFAFCVVIPGVVNANALERLFAPKSELWDRWTQHAPQDDRQISHAEWNRFLHTYVADAGDGINRVDYASVSHRERTALGDYVDRLSSIRVSGYSRPEQFAYWVNLYNALTVQLVLDHYPVESIRDIDISPGLFADGPWRKRLVTVEGEALTLDDIEHRILRPVWNDPRIHYAVNCAALGCPNLQAMAFTAENAERLLEAGARDYINDPRGARIEQGRLTVSSIYSWFRADFDQHGGVIAHIKRYAAPGLLAELEGIDHVSGFDYDWSLNAGSTPQG
jgi:hypothetical protein